MNFIEFVIMASLAISMLGIFVLFVLAFRNEMVFRFRIKTIDKDRWDLHSKYSYQEMIFDFKKWTYKQFYGEE